MSIPPLVNGVLPPGTYSATLDEVRAAFDQAGSRTRLTLHAALAHAAAFIWSRDATAILYVNGSYVTDKVDPIDVDVAVRSDVWDDTQFAAAFSAVHPGEEALVDFYFNPTQSAQHMEELFREIQGSTAKKGIIQLMP
jgi:hypothetical protein